ncbi:hypothetical protein [Aquimarina sp. 2201CG14-23]|uniref:hypothetical protein n=1 Tax=Aquimarina mycalae TaxID=3040073 RepID=UPI002477CC76|nr:hypothetical protein [Aquimarina sp. 2201CG14-23]MDH7447917.1 hypothetical protein [Aquimarina sp. 2201CG14-23]
MSQNAVNNFISLLLSRNIHDLVVTYYDESVEITLNKNIQTNKKLAGMNLLLQTLSYMQILQFKVVDIEHSDNKLSYTIFLITKNQNNIIDFSKHHIVNTWKNNLIYRHNHLITND